MSPGPAPAPFTGPGPVLRHECHLWSAPGPGGFSGFSEKGNGVSRPGLQRHMH